MKYGYFVGTPKTSWSSNDAWMIMLEDFTYVDQTGKHWLAPTGCEIDGASIPRVFWTLIGSPYTGPYRRAAVVHDCQCILKVEPWRDVHEMFYNAARCGGVSEAMAKTLYYAIYHFGPRWINGKPIAQGPLPADLDVKKIYEDIKKYKFALEDIRRLD